MATVMIVFASIQAGTATQLFSMQSSEDEVPQAVRIALALLCEFGNQLSDRKSRPRHGHRRGFAIVLYLCGVGR
jgi:hypothetical protein